MDHVKLRTRLHLEAPVAALDDAAELAYYRALQVAGMAETSGLITPAMLPLLVRGWTPAKARRIAQRLEAAELLIPTPDGWFIAGWDVDQAAIEDIITRRAADRARQARRRAASRDDTDPDPDPRHVTPSRDMSRDVTAPEERRGEETAATAADARGGGGDPDLASIPNPIRMLNVSDLVTALGAGGAVARWDRLTLEQLEHIGDLVDVHGVARLVDAARRSAAAHTTPVAYAQAWLPVWDSLPAPGATVATVPAEQCPDHQGQDLRTCAGCRADRLAGANA